MDTELLKTFMKSRAIRHFGRAAENLYLTSFGGQLSHLPAGKRVGVELFSRASVTTFS